MRVRNALIIATSALVGASALSGFAATGATADDSGAPGTAPYDSCPYLVAAQGGGGPGQTDTKYPENSMAAFKRSISYGAWALETDVRYTKDSQLVLMKDETLNRTTTGKGNVSDYTLEQLKQFTLKNGEPIPTFIDFTTLLAKTNMKGFVEYHDRQADPYEKKFLNEVTDSEQEIYAIGDRSLMRYAEENDYAEPVIWMPDTDPGTMDNPASDGGNPVDGHWESHTVSAGPPEEELIKPWPRQSDMPEGADIAMLGMKTTQEWVDLMRSIEANLYAYFDYTTGKSGDNPTSWGQLTLRSTATPPPAPNAVLGAPARWIASTNVPRYLTWNNNNGDGTCNKQPPRKQWLKCFELRGDESPLPMNSKTVLLKKGCRTTALHHVKVKLKAKKGVAKLISNGGRRVVQTFDQRGKVTITLTAKPGLGYEKYQTKHVRYVRDLG